MTLKTFPKVELHRHMDCSLRVETVREISRTLKLDLPTDNLEDFKNAVLIREPMKDLKTVLEKFLVTQKVLSSPEIIERMAYEAVEDAFNDSIKIIEMRYSPSFIRSGHENLNFDLIHKSIMTGIQNASEEFDITVGLLGIIGRNDPLALATEVSEFIIENKRDFVGVDLADNEVDFDCKKFSQIFEKLKSEGLRTTIHAGEPNYPGAIQSVKDAVEVLGAERIGHGIQVATSDKAIQYILDKKIHLEICPTSNYITQSVPSIQEHPIKKLYDAGVSLSINTDDPGIFDYDLTHEYEVLKNTFGFGPSEFNRCNQMAYEASFIDERLKARFW